MTLPVAPLTAESYDYQFLDRQRRLNLVRNFDYLAIPSLAIYFLALIISQLTSGLALTLIASISDISVIFALSLYTFSIVMVQRRHVDQAAAATVVALNLGVLGLSIGQITSQGLNPTTLTGFTAYVIPILLAGLLATPQFVILSTLSMNALATFYLCIPGLPTETIIQSLVDKSRLLTLSQTLIFQWFVAIIIIVVGNSYRSTLRDLGESRLLVKRAQELDELKNQFISSVNHELRNPVMALQGYTETIMVGVKRRMDYAFLEDLAVRANQTGLNLRALIQSILEVKDLDLTATDQPRTAVNVRVAIQNATMMIDPREGKMIERDLHIQVTSDLAVWCDPIRFQQVLTNLLSNAIKYSQPGTPIYVSAHVYQPAANQSQEATKNLRMVEVTVKDAGFGIPPEQIPLLFNKFMRLPRDLASNIIGNGLGLYLCKEIIEGANGHIWVESTGVTGEGTTFHVTLPMPPTTTTSNETVPLSATTI